MKQWGRLWTEVTWLKRCYWGRSSELLVS